MRRATFTAQPVTYASVGGTQAVDLMSYPPRGYRPFDQEVRLGSGRERFSTASAQVMTWGVHTGSGFTVEDAEPGTGVEYTGVTYDSAGTPVDGVRTSAEQRFAADGTPFITAGMTATLVTHVAGFRIAAPVRVVYVIDEPHRVGFACGTLPGHPQSGEMSFVVEHRDDDSVWLHLRSFSRPGTPLYRLGAPILRAMQRRTNERFLRALLPGRGA